MNRRYMMILLFAIIGVFVFSENTYAAECELPSSAGKVTVKQEGDKPIYEFIVSNNSDAPIYSIAIGIGAYYGIKISGEYIPKEVMSAEGWKGRHAFQHEGEHMWYLWTTNDWRKRDDRYVINSGETLSGFKIVLESSVDSVMSLPYVIDFRKIGCLNGVVEKE